MGKHSGGHGLGWGAEVGGEGRYGAGEDEGSEDSKELAKGKSGGVAIYYEDLRRRGGVQVVKVGCEGGDELAFGAVAVEADIERLGELEAPLGEGAGVEGVEEGDGGFMRVGIGAYLVVVLLVGEEREGGDGVVGGFRVSGAVLEEILLVRWEVWRGCRRSFSSGTFALFSTGLGGRFGSCRFPCQHIFHLVLDMAIFYIFSIPDLPRENIFFVAQVVGDCLFNYSPCTLPPSRAVRICKWDCCICSIIFGGIFWCFE